MPYIPIEDQKKLDPDNTVDQDGSERWIAETPGELNYLITKTIQYYIRDNGGPSYTSFNEVIGVLECVKQEFYRRAVTPYEEVKKAQNGDVY